MLLPKKYLLLSFTDQIQDFCDVENVLEKCKVLFWNVVLTWNHSLIVYSIETINLWLCTVGNKKNRFVHFFYCLNSWCSNNLRNFTCYILYFTVISQWHHISPWNFQCILACLVLKKLLMSGLYKILNNFSKRYEGFCKLRKIVALHMRHISQFFNIEC